MVHGVFDPQYQRYGKKILVGTYLNSVPAIQRDSICVPIVYFSIFLCVFTSTVILLKGSSLPCLHIHSEGFLL
jgi:hypothetical protein